ncbi:MAG TPA: dihydrolipoyl dehydrogenase [Candidatus Limnocylindria bacterium]|nr:dihydrolipoyl dehydrogenase [Candidatus Limnocylindria bacterium]
MPKYDLVIIGSGPGGYVAAIRAGQWGLKVAVVEKDPFLGGTCLHVGCIPTKVFLHHADIYDHFKRAEEFGFEVKDIKVNWPAILTRKDKIVKKHSLGIAALFKKNKVESITGWGRIAGPGRVSVEKDGKTTELETTNIMLATGSEARSLPGVEIDGKTVLTNREILTLQEIPKSMVIVGCGAVGVEFASIFKTFGTDVTLLEVLPRVVPLEDEDISAELEKSFRKKGVRIELEAKVESVKKDAKGAIVTYKDKTGKSQTINAEKVLMAVGRRPLTENIGLEKTKAKLDRGYVLTNVFLETDEPRLYAIGDIVAGLPQLAHAASMEGIIAVGRMAGKDVQAFDKKRCPNATYCEPQIGSIGLTERQAREAGYQVKTGKFPFLGNSKATILGQHEGFIKVVAEEKYGEILGVHAIGPLATEIIAEPVAALGLEATLDDMAATIHAHPTVWEAMGDAFNAVRGLSINF